VLRRMIEFHENIRLFLWAAAAKSAVYAGQL
jgi:hypothetical protein